MIRINAYLEQPDFFYPDRELAYVVETENLIDGNKTTMRVIPSYLPKYKDKITRSELINTVTRLVNQRYNNYKYAETNSPTWKWEASKRLLKRLDTLNVLKSVYPVCRFIDHHMMFDLEGLIPAETSPYYPNYTKRLSALKSFVKEQILAYDRTEIVMDKEVENLKN